MKSALLILPVLLFAIPSFGMMKCTAALKNVEKVSALKASKEEIADLFAKYPAFKPAIALAHKKISETSLALPDQPITDIQQVETGSIRNYDASYSPEKLAALDPRLKDTLIAVFNALKDKKGLANYTKKLMQDAAVEMAKTPSARTRELKNFPPENDYSGPDHTANYTTKKQYLELGQLDHQSLLKVLVHRIRNRGGRISYIPERGNYNENTTRTQKFNDFYNVPKHGPFIDKAFGPGDSHGQDVHLLQMDYVAEIVFKKTKGNPQLFWDYVNTRGTGGWAWDTMFDGMNGTWMEPEKIGPVLRQHIPLF
ncbi:MAG: hypothetical protein V4736_02480 [Bdellovibrionota bacterium]